MTHAPSLAFAGALFAVAACGATRDRGAPAAETAAAAADPAFRVDFLATDKLSDALERARAEGKLVFVDFYTSWCLPCRLMDEDVFTDPAFGEFMNERFVSVKIDAEAGNGPELATLYGVRAYPTLLWVDPEGRVRARREGAAYQTELRALSRAALGAVN